jgi:ribosomal protein S18 acetylase RimI-like enzyme
VDDESLLFELFAFDKRAEFAAAGVPAAQSELLLITQYRGRERTYRERYPCAEDLILLGDDGTPAGRLLIQRETDCWRIAEIAVLSALRGRGLCTRTLQECQAQCERTGARLELQVASGNPARRLYERLGFRVTGEDAVAATMVWSAEAGAARGSE